MTSIRIALILAAALALLSGCETMEKSWDSTWGTTKGYYKEYINPDPTVDYEARDWGSSEEKLAELFTPVDKPIDLLGVYLNRKDRFPEDEWTEKLFASFPWVSGLAVVSLGGDVLYQRPETSLKPLNPAPALAVGQELADRRLRSYIDMTPLGPEMYLATALYKENDLAGVILVHFDLRKVLEFCPQPNDLVILTLEDVVWPGSDTAEATSLLALPWVETLKNEIQGRVSDGGREYIWLTRYIGDHQLIYLTQAVDDEKAGFSLFGLF